MGTNRSGRTEKVGSELVNENKVSFKRKTKERYDRSLTIQIGQVSGNKDRLRRNWTEQERWARTGRAKLEMKERPMRPWTDRRDTAGQ